MFISNMPSFNCDKLMVPTAFHVLLSKSTWADLSYKPNLYLHGCVDFRSSLLPWWSQWLSRSIGQWGRPWLAMKLPLEIEMNQNATQVTARFLLLWVKYRATQSRCNYIYYIDRVFWFWPISNINLKLLRNSINKMQREGGTFSANGAPMGLGSAEPLWARRLTSRHWTQDGWMLPIINHNKPSWSTESVQIIPK